MTSSIEGACSSSSVPCTTRGRPRSRGYRKPEHPRRNREDAGILGPAGRLRSMNSVPDEGGLDDGNVVDSVQPAHHRADVLRPARGDGMALVPDLGWSMVCVHHHVDVHVKQDAAVYPCRYCGWKMPVSAEVFDENPFCASCLNERMRRTTDPLDGPRLECGLPLERVVAQDPKPLRPLAKETT